MSNLYPGDLRELVIEPGDELDTETAVYVLCPAHDDKSRPSLRVYPNGAHCFTCGKHYHRDEFCALFDDKHITSTKLRQWTHTSHIKPKVDPLVIARSAHQGLLEVWGSSTSDWLEARGINQTLVQQYWIGHNGVAYTFPIWEQDGHSIYSVRYRRDDAVNPKMMKYWGLRGLNDLRLYPYPLVGSTMVLTEGELDALLLRRYGLPAFSWTNGASSIPTAEQWRAMAPHLNYVVLCRDQDAPGRKSSQQMSHSLDALGVTYKDLQWPEAQGKDITEVWQRDQAMFEYTLQRMRRYLTERATE